MLLGNLRFLNLQKKKKNKKWEKMSTLKLNNVKKKNYMLIKKSMYIKFTYDYVKIHVGDFKLL